MRGCGEGGLEGEVNGQVSENDPLCTLHSGVVGGWTPGQQAGVGCHAGQAVHPRHAPGEAADAGSDRRGGGPRVPGGAAQPGSQADGWVRRCNLGHTAGQVCW